MTDGPRYLGVLTETNLCMYNFVFGIWVGILVSHFNRRKQTERVWALCEEGTNKNM